ncbi:aldose 1-epimerase [Sphingomonas sp. RB1R13]|uniref:aldose 1-epimerase n=1 Tax=Sphingomonas sp. RB1R13 TaxID=3096159 RepID=UPI002FCA04FF
MTSWLTLTAGDLVLDLAPDIGGSIARFRKGAQELLRPAPRQASDAGEMASFPLVPFSNRVRGGTFVCDGRTVTLAPNLPGDKSPLHGQGWRAPWQVEQSDAASATLSFVHEPGEWPWHYEARQLFMLDESGLTVTLSCRNRSPERMPCGLAQHPYFPCDGTTRLTTGVTDVWLIDADVLPTNRVPASGKYLPSNGPVCGRGLDHGFEGWSGDALVDWGKGAKVRLTAAAPRFQLYAPATGGLFVAEPVENANAALNLPQEEWVAAGLVLLDQGEERSLAVRFEVED